MKHEGGIRGYHRYSKAWYYQPGSLIGLSIGIYHKEYGNCGGTSGEFLIEWKELGKRLVPQLKVFEDSWATLLLFQDLLGKMAEVGGDCIQEEEFCKILDSLGIEDLTEYTNQHF